MKKNQEPEEMELVEGGLNPDEMGRILGVGCVCSVGSADANVEGGTGCQCSYGNLNLFANFAKAI